MQVARWFFGGQPVAGPATLTSWYDALTGGAMIGRLGGPLLLTEPDRLDPATALYLNEASASVGTVALIGGPNALSDVVMAQAGDACGLPGHWDAHQSTPTNNPTS